MTDSKSVIAPFAKDADDDFDIRTVLGFSGEGASDLGEVLAALGGVKKGDHRAWFAAWLGLAERTLGVADASAAGGHRVSAAEAYLRSSSYFSFAVNAASAADDDAQLATSFARQEKAWTGFVANSPTPVEAVQIPYEGGTMPGWLFRPDGAAPTRPTLVVVNGSDGPRSGAWAVSGAAAVKRGYNVLLFDGPGQQSMLFDRNVPFRPDWEHVLGPVYEFLSAQPGVDPTRIALYGWSQGGYWVPRALTAEHRYCAAIADPGVVDVSASWTAQVPGPLLSVYEKGDAEKFDKDMAFGMKLAAETARTWAFRARPYGANGYAATLDAVRSYTIAESARAITTPLLITAPEHEQFWPGQAQQLGDLTTAVSTILPFMAAEGADLHCEPLARSVVAQRMFDWLDDRVDAART